MNQFSKKVINLIKLRLRITLLVCFARTRMEDDRLETTCDDGPWLLFFSEVFIVPSLSVRARKPRKRLRST